MRGAALELRRVAWTVPEWPWVLLVSGAWLVLGAHAGHRHPMSLGAWVVMVVAMMLPATLPVVRTVSFGSMWRRRHRAPAIFLAAYVLVWTAFGAVALAAWSVLALRAAAEPAAAAGLLLLVAAAWQLTARHNRFLKRSHRTLPLGARGLRADRACLRYGAYHARQCVGACWPLMLAMIPGHHLPGMMLAVAAVSTWERVARRPRRRACAALLAGLALVALLQASV